MGVTTTVEKREAFGGGWGIAQVGCGSEFRESVFVRFVTV
jgi:hypothetical protein